MHALKNPLYEEVFRFTHFNPIQTQIFHVTYHTDHNMLVGAPTGSGKTVAAELAVMRLMNACGRAGSMSAVRATRPRCKAVYIAPLKALVAERIKDWRRKFKDRLGWR